MSNEQCAGGCCEEKSISQSINQPINQSVNHHEDHSVSKVESCCGGFDHDSEINQTDDKQVVNQSINQSAANPEIKHENDYDCCGDHEDARQQTNDQPIKHPSSINQSINEPPKPVKYACCSSSSCCESKEPVIPINQSIDQLPSGCYDACCDSRSSDCWSKSKSINQSINLKPAVTACASGCCEPKPKPKPLIKVATAASGCADACCGAKPIINQPVAAAPNSDSCKSGCCEEKTVVDSPPISTSCSKSATATKAKDSCCAPKKDAPAPKSSCKDSCCDSKPVKPMKKAESGSCKDACCPTEVDVVKDDCCSGPLIQSIDLGLKQARRLFQICCDLCWQAEPGRCCGKACCSSACCLLKAHREMLNMLKRAANDPKENQSINKPTNQSISEDVTVQLMVRGLTCADCSASVVKNMVKVNGIISCNVSTMTGQTTVIYNPNKIDQLTEKESKDAGLPTGSEVPESIAIERFIRIIDQIGFSTSIAESSVLQFVEFTIDSEELKTLSINQSVNQTVEIIGMTRDFMFDKAIVYAMLALQAQPGVIEGSAFHTIDSVTHRRIIRCQIDRSIVGPRKLVQLMNQTSLYCSLVPINQSNAPAKAPASMEAMWRFQFAIGLLFCIPIIIIAFILPATDGSANRSMNQSVNNSNLSVGHLLLFIFTTPIQLILGWPLMVSAHRSARYAKAANADLLVVLSSSIAYLYSFVTICLQAANVQGNDSIGQSVSQSHDSESQFFETSAILLTLIALGRYLEVLAKGKTGDIIEKLDQMNVTSATLLVDYQSVNQSSDQSINPSFDHLKEEEISMDLIERDDVVKVLPGARVPSDGVVVWGNTMIDQSLVTGESMAVNKSIGDTVYSGTINQSGVIHVKITKTANENTLSVISDLVRDAQSSQPTTQRVADKIAGIFVPVILLMSVIVFVVWIIIAETGSVSIGDSYNSATFALRFAIVTLVISCPCALGLATPTAVMAGAAVGAKRGVLFKSGEIIERCAHVNTVVFDKTGTITMGQPSITHVQFTKSAAHHQHEQADLWRWLSLAESGSDHPLAHALMAFCNDQLTVLSAPEQVVKVHSSSEVAGKGVTCRIDDHELLVGSKSFMSDNNVDLSAVAHDTSSSGHTLVYFAVDNQLAMIIRISDALRPEARGVIEALKALGIDVWLCSGDSQQAASSIGAQAGISSDRVLGDQLPQDKAELVSRLQSEGLKVSMVGDGVNDSVALARADVGIAVAKGTDIAAEAAHVILMKDDLRDVLLTYHLARRTFKCIRFNFFWAFLYNLFAIPLAVGIFYPAGQVSIPPALAGVAELLSSVPVVLFSLMLRFYTPLTAGTHDQVTVDNAPVTIIVQ